MSSSSETYHEPLHELSQHTREMHRALVSLQEELEAVDWYQQRADATKNTELREVLLHNMREEMEHAAMIIEWLRRTSVNFDEHIRTYLFSEGPIHAVEEETTASAQPEEQNHEPNTTANQARRWTVGSLKES